MIKLYDLLVEQIGNKPKAIILAGAPGAGKGYVLKGLNLNGLKVLNIDNTYIEKLKQANVSLDLKNSSPEERSKQAVQMAASNKEFKSSVKTTIEAKESFILDGTAASYKQTAELKDELEKAGYKVMMLYVYTDLERSLQQNQDRFEKSGGEDRSLAPAIVMRTWMNVTKNYEPYRELFGGYASSNFALVSNTLDGNKLTDIEDIIDKYLTPFKPTGTKDKSPAQKERSAKQYAEMKDDIQKLLGNDFVEDITSDGLSKEEAQMRIGKFLSS
jgi:adenylate kinase family enzyme